MSSLAQPALTDGLVDDAAVFPPGLAPMQQAVDDHHGHRSRWYRRLVGPLLVPVPGLDELCAVLGRRPAAAPVRIGLVADRNDPDPLAALLRAAAAVDVDSQSRAAVVSTEIALPASGDQAKAAAELSAALDRDLAPGVTAWVEVNRGDDTAAALEVLAAAPCRVGAKFRTGGVEADLFPSAAELAAVLHRAHRLRVPLKLTAGLHHAVRHTDAGTGTTHHGFANVLAAVARARAGGSPDDLAQVLDVRDGVALADSLRELDEGGARDVRSTFASFGCCGVTDPVQDLVQLGLLAAPERAEAPRR